MKTKILSLLVILAIAVASCQKDEADKPVVLQDVSFGIEHVDPLGLKNDDFDIVCPDDLNPVKARIVIEGIAVPFEPLVFFLNGKWYTQAIKLEPGAYTIEEFYLLDANDDVIMATPAKGSVYEVYVEEGVDIDFTVVEFTKIEIPIDVLCYEPARFDEFGFFWFQVDRIVVRTFCFFGDICANGEPYEPADFANTAYANVPGGLQVDMPAIFEIRAFDSEGVALPYSPFSNLGEEDEPLCVEYPDNIDIAGETFTFELWVLGPDGTYTLYHTFTVTDDQIDITDIDEDDVIEFVVGNCNYSATDLQLAWIVPPPPPVIDGIINAGEWDGAAQIDVTGGKGTVYVQVLGDYLYVGMDINDNTDARLGQNLVGNDQVGLNINPTDGGSWGFPYDIIFQTGADPNAWGGTSSGQIDGWETQWSIEVAGVTTQQPSLPAGLESLTLYSGGKRITEWKIPLGGVVPVKVGGAIDIGDGNSYAFPIGLNWGDASSFFDL